MTLVWFLGPPPPAQVENPPPFDRNRWPCPEYVTPDMEGPAQWSLMPCGCHLRQTDYEAVLCDEHLAELNAGIRETKD